MNDDATWTIDDAKANFADLIQSALTRPQTITRDGEPTAVLVSPLEWQLLKVRSGGLADFLLRSPLQGSDIDIAPRDPTHREIDL